MAKKAVTKNEWKVYLKIVEKYARDLKKFVTKMKPGDVVASGQGPGSNPPPPPPPPPGHP